MPIERHIFDVEYTDDPTSFVVPREFRTRVTMADKIDAETHGPQYGVMDQTQQPQLVGLLWLWYSSLREGHVDESTTFADFRVRCLDNALVKEAEPVPPTGTAGGSRLASVASIPVSPMPSGSTPSEPTSD